MRVNEDFDDVIFTDESTIQLEHHSRLCFRKHHMPRLLKQRAKHPVKINVWGGISKRGATNNHVHWNHECRAFREDI